MRRHFGTGLSALRRRRSRPGGRAVWVGLAWVGLAMAWLAVPTWGQEPPNPVSPGLPASVTDRTPDVGPRLAEARDQLTELQRAERQRWGMEAVDVETLQGACGNARRAADVALAQPPGEAGRQEAIDASYVELQRCAADLHDWLATRRQEPPRSAALEAWRTQWLDPKAGALPPEAFPQEVAAWTTLRRSFATLVDERRDHRGALLDQVLESLAASARGRWSLHPKMSDGLRSRSGQQLIPELRAEVDAVRDIALHRFERGMQIGRDWPMMLVDVLALRTLLWESLLLIALVLLWRRWRRQAQAFCRHVARWQMAEASTDDVRSRTPWPKASDRLIEAGAAVWTACLDVALLIAVYGLMFYGSATATPWLWIALLWIAWRAVPSLALLAIASPIEQRRALMVGNRRVQRHIVMTLRSVMGWAAVSLLVTTVLRQTLVSYRLVEMAQLLARWALLLLVIFLLDRWAPLLRHQVRRLEDSRWNRWLAHQPAGGRVAALLKAALTVVFLGVRWIFLALTRLLGGKGDFSWWTMRLARNDLQEHQKVRQPLTPEERQRIRQASMLLSRDDEMDRLMNSLAAARQGRQRGLAALIADRGAGKSCFLDRLAAAVTNDSAAAGLQVERWGLRRHLLGTRDGLRWVLEQLSEKDDAEDLVLEQAAEDELMVEIQRRLSARPPTLFLVDDVHFAVRRAVGGFDAFKAIKNCFYGSSQRHFWVLAFHRPAWTFLEAVAVDINLQVFRTRLTLDGWSADELSTWLSGRTREAGFELDYSRLIRRGPFDDESQDDAERARQAYWHLLTNASSGNPEVAFLHWLESLCHADGNRRLAVTLFEEPLAAEIDNPRDTELFVLAALWMHGRLPVKALVDVLNMPLGRIEMACRHLDSLGVLSEEATLGYSLAGRWRPSVERWLKQRHFIHVAS